METNQLFSIENWITIIIAIVASILIPLFIYIFKLLTRKRKKVFYEKRDKEFLQLNSQLWSNDFLNSRGKLSFKRITTVHYIIFRGETFKSGILRSNKDAYIGSPNQKAYTNLYGKSNVKSALKKNIRMWNKWIKQEAFDYKSKIDLVSRFHIRFVIIHPFLDGNGRIGRMLISEQLSFLFGELVDFKPNMQDYYKAIIQASHGNETELKRIIMSCRDKVYR